MSGFDEAKDKAQDFMGQAKEKFGQQDDQNQGEQNQGDQQDEGLSGRGDDLRGKASDAMDNARERFGN
ncbi:CsbD family protein [Actinophytocola algeriensis]|uniref:Uncharacterized protein YjbJ (UPF0337 family) n=1 Tax=Actinophytocola algeriensis TaxID=1768010 RepID=A0A7W7Q4S2_9PSEU|nr:CsbD family protein [Actinophytocola algeriensis]MBB4906969.1 uncharacterized protein YjbJ (UPF0337 family) [Actinophytocola algeriensis]MBE1478452.1 uncharacterized protein YjbJ (UPF0337 family) [Actinophytocola algeriensis]